MLKLALSFYSSLYILGIKFIVYIAVSFFFLLCMLSVDLAEAFIYNPICQLLELFSVLFESNNGLEMRCSVVEHLLTCKALFSI